MSRPIRNTVRILTVLALSLLIAACGSEPVISDDMMRFEGAMPADFSGSWERDYSRGEEANAALGAALYELNRRSANSGVSGQSWASSGAGEVSQRQRASMFALARLADEITRPQVLTVSQTDSEISIAREDDYAIFCAFYDGRAKVTESGFGKEVCGWDGEQLVSHAELPGGLEVTHRFTVSQDRKKLRVVTTVDSSTAPMPFTLSRFYNRFEAPASSFNCIETLSMKRVCSTSDIEL